MRTRFGSVALNCARQRWTHHVWGPPLNGRMPTVCQCVLQRLPRNVRMVRHRALWAVCRQQRLRCTISRCHVLACVAIPHGAHFWFRRLKFTHATVLTLTIRNCCHKFRFGACSHSVRKVCVCHSMHVAKGASYFCKFVCHMRIHCILRITC